jgi:hypothetical protein
MRITENMDSETRIKKENMEYLLCRIPSVGVKTY